jgi:puromycin-sensitive aminopeptidase
LDSLIKGGALRSPLLKATDRLGIQGDAWALAKAGELSTVQVLALLESYKDETDYTVWSGLTGNIGGLDAILTDSPIYPIWRKFCVALYAKVGASLGWDPKEGDNHLSSLLRGLALTKLGLCGHEETIAEAKKRFVAFIAGEEVTLMPDLRSGTYRIALKHGDQSTFDQIIDLYKKASMHEEKERCMEALGAPTDVALLQRSIDFAMSEDVRLQDAVFVIARVAANPAGRELAWDYLKKNADALYKKYSGGFLIGRLVKGCTQNFLSLEKAKEVEAFFAEHPPPSADRAVKQAIEEIKNNVAWLERDHDAIKKWLEDWASKQQ